MEIKRCSGVLVKCEDKVLLCKRNKEKTFPGMWSIPGGGMEEGESSKECAKREFFEETSVDIDDDDLEFIGIIPCYRKEWKEIKGYMYVYLLVVDEEIIPDLEMAMDGFEHTACDYFKLSEIDPLTTGDNLYNLIKTTI
jgi:ADP-ribose pyrophosphatase YjhB (NUDIX family)